VASYAVAYDSTLGGYKVGTVTVTSLDAACATKTVSVTLTGAAGVNLNTVTGVVPAGGGAQVLTPGSTVSAALVTGLSVGSQRLRAGLRTGGQVAGETPGGGCLVPQYLLTF